MSNLTFAPGETDIREARFSPSVLLFWLRFHMAVTNTRIVFKRPNTFLGLIPLGYQDAAFPLKNIASAGVDVKFSMRRAVWGLIFFIVGLSLLGKSVPLGVILALLGFSMLANAVSAGLKIENNGGGISWVYVSVFQKSALEQFRNEVNHRLFADNEGLRHSEVMGVHQTSVQLQQAQLQEMQGMYRPAPPAAPQMPRQYQVGDVVNGHRFNGSAWIPLAPGADPSSPTGYPGS